MFQFLRLFPVAVCKTLIQGIHLRVSKEFLFVDFTKEAIGIFRMTSCLKNLTGKTIYGRLFQYGFRMFVLNDEGLTSKENKENIWDTNE